MYNSYVVHIKSTHMLLLVYIITKYEKEIKNKIKILCPNTHSIQIKYMHDINCLHIITDSI